MATIKTDFGSTKIKRHRSGSGEKQYFAKAHLRSEDGRRRILKQFIISSAGSSRRRVTAYQVEKAINRLLGIHEHELREDGFTTLYAISVEERELVWEWIPTEEEIEELLGGMLGRYTSKVVVDGDEVLEVLERI